MPLFSKHSNRSKHALDDSSAGTTSTTTIATTPTSPASPAGKTDEARATTTQPTTQTQTQPDHQHQQRHSQQLQLQPPPPQLLPRSSQPYAASSVEAGSPTIDYPHPGTLVRPQSTYTSPFPQLVPVSDRRSVDDLALTTPRTQFSQFSSPRSQGQSPVVEQKKSRGLFDRMRSSARTPDTTNPSSPPQGNALSPSHSRRLSRRLQNTPAIRTSSASSPDQAQHLDWQTAQAAARSYLPSPQERAEDRSDLDPFLVQELERPGTRTSTQEVQQLTIRSVPSELEDPSTYPNQDDGHQNRRSLIQGQLEVPPNSIHQGQSQGQQLSPYQDALGISHDPYSQNFETVSQLSFDASTEPREDIPVSNGNSPTSNNTSQRAEHPNRTTPATRGQREGSQYLAMAPPTGTLQQPRRTADPKQAVQAIPGQQDARDSASYRQAFTGNSTPTTLPSASPLPTGPGADYRGGPPQREQFGQSGGGDRGRNTPPPAGERDVNDAYKEIREFMCKEHAKLRC